MMESRIGKWYTWKKDPGIYYFVLGFNKRNQAFMCLRYGKDIKGIEYNEFFKNSATEMMKVPVNFADIDHSRIYLLFKELFAKRKKNFSIKVMVERMREDQA